MRFKIALLVTAMAGMALSGCATGVVENPLTTRLSGDDPDTQIEFLHDLADRKLTSNDEAFHALLMFADGKSPASYDARVAMLKQEGLVSQGFDEPANHAVRRGTVAVILCHALKVRGGVSMMIFGVRERYAVRELVDLEVFPTSSPDQTFSGTEFVGILGKAEDYQRGGGGDKTPNGVQGDPK